MEPAHTNTVAYSELGDAMDGRTDLSDDANALMAKSLLVMTIMLVSTANPTMRNFNQNLSRPWFTMPRTLHNISRFGAFEHGEVDTHVW